MNAKQGCQNAKEGCQIFGGAVYQTEKKYTKRQQKHETASPYVK
jgi:hypothetical protein